MLWLVITSTKGYPWSSLIDTQWTAQWTLDRHSVETNFSDTSLSVNTKESVGNTYYWPTIDQVSIEMSFYCWQSMYWDVDWVSIQMLKECSSRVLIDIWPWCIVKYIMTIQQHSDQTLNYFPIPFLFAISFNCDFTNVNIWSSLS